IQRDVLAGREGQARRRPERRVEVRAAELVVGDESAGGCIKARHGVPPFLPSFPRTTTARALSSRFTTNGASPDRPRGADTVEFPHCPPPAAPPSPTPSMSPPAPSRDFPTCCLSTWDEWEGSGDPLEKGAAYDDIEPDGVPLAGRCAATRGS